MRRILILGLSVLSLASQAALHGTTLAQEAPLSIHQKAATCFEDDTATFPSDPTTCEDVCLTCHTDLQIAAIEGQTYNPESTQTDEAYPGLVSEEEEDPWLSLPAEHQSCRLCHTDYAENEGNHPIFEDISETLQDDALKAFDGLLLCATCHNPHKITIALLRKSNSGSALCLTCHLM